MTGVLRDLIDATGRSESRLESQRKRVHTRVEAWKRQSDTELRFINQKAVALETFLKAQSNNLANRGKLRLARLDKTLNAVRKPIDAVRRRVMKKTR